MRGQDRQQSGMFSYILPEQRVPENHPLRAIRAMTDEALSALSAKFQNLYAMVGRPSIPQRSFCERCFCKCFTPCAVSGC